MYPRLSRLVLDADSGRCLLTGETDPTVDGLNVPLGSLYIMVTNGGVVKLFLKTGVGLTDWTVK